MEHLAKKFWDTFYPMRGYFALLAVLFIAVAVIAIVQRSASPNIGGGREESSLSEKIRRGQAPLPALTSIRLETTNKNGVQHLVSYTDEGFEPQNITVVRGETVRFTNNSSDGLWVAGGGSEARIYPRTIDACGSSDLDSCGPLAPQEFWDFTFDISGEWGVANGLEREKTIVIVVE